MEVYELDMNSRGGCSVYFSGFTYLLLYFDDMVITMLLICVFFSPFV